MTKGIAPEHLEYDYKRDYRPGIVKHFSPTPVRSGFESGQLCLDNLVKMSLISSFVIEREATKRARRGIVCSMQATFGTTKIKNDSHVYSAPGSQCQCAGARVSKLIVAVFEPAHRLDSETGRPTSVDRVSDAGVRASHWKQKEVGD